jgi:hypothetical protein
LTVGNLGVDKRTQPRVPFLEKVDKNKVLSQTLGQFNKVTQTFISASKTSAIDLKHQGNKHLSTLQNTGQENKDPFTRDNLQIIF